MAARRHVLCISSYFKGNRFLERCREEGWHLTLLTAEKMLKEPWAREAIDEIYAVPSFEDRKTLISAVAYLFRTRPFERLVALDDFDVEVGAHLREHFRLEGLGETNARFFRDKLAMRIKARELGIRVPDFSPVHHHGTLDAFLRKGGPWLVKPRMQASAIGIAKVQTIEEAWNKVNSLGDEQTFHLVEKMIEGDMYHVDSLVSEGKVVFAEVNKYHRPLLEVSHGGGIYATRTLPRDAPEVKKLRAMNEKVLTGFGLVRGASHTEFIIGKHDGEPYFIETSARVGGANIAELVEAATGVNLWSEWAKIELEGEGFKYKPPQTRSEYAGVTISLARQEWPDLSVFSDPEVVQKIEKKQHVGVVLRSTSAERVDELLGKYREIIRRDFHAAMPPPPKATA